MSYTGHKKTKLPSGQSVIDWVQPTLEQESAHYKVPMPTKEQVALVMSALRMHHIIEHAAGYDNSELGKPDEVTKYWPIESSIGRYFRDAAREILEENRNEKV